MQIALITDGIWPYVLGGMQKHSFYLCKYLAQNKVNIHLFHYNKSNFDINKLEFFSDEERKYIQSSIVDFPKSVYFPGNYLYNSYKHSRLIFEIIKPTLSNYDFIYTKGFTGWYLINQKKIKSISCPPIGVKFHGYEMFQPSPNFKTKLQNVFLLQGIVKSISKNADYVFSYGGKISEIVKSLGISPSKIIELPSAVELKIVSDNIQPTSENIKFLFLGRYERRKGIEELNLAIDLFFKLNPNSNCEFNFIGPIPNNKKINHHKVSYHGTIIDSNSLFNLIKQNDVLICPSWSEGMPNVILESMANGLTSIATDVGSTHLLVNPKTGWLIQNVDANEIYKTICLVLSTSAEEINQKKQSALQLIKDNFVWETLIKKLLQQLNTLK